MFALSIFISVFCLAFLVRAITYHSSRELASSTTHIGGILICEENKAIRAKEG
jgi:hypothetical protein